MSRLPMALSLLLSMASTMHAGPAAALQRLWPTQEQWQHLHAGGGGDPLWHAAEAAVLQQAEQARQREPDPIARLSSEGRLKGDPLKTRTATSLDDMARIQALAIAYALRGEQRDAQAAGRYLERWAAVNVPTGNPIDETRLEPAIFAYRIIRPTLPKASRNTIDAWMRQIAQAEIASRDMRRRTATNNWHSHRLKTVGLIGLVLDDAGLVAYAHDGFKRQIADNLHPDGRSSDFIHRDALVYHAYTLKPLVTLALALSERGEDLYHWRAANGASLAGSMAWFLPYLRGDKTHAEFVGTQSAFDKARSDNGERGHVIGTPYVPRSALPLLELTAAYDSECAHLAEALSRRPPSWRLVVSRQPD